MAKETRLGTDPLQWIQDSRQNEPEFSTPSIPSKQSVPSNQDVSSKQSVPNNQSVLSKQGVHQNPQNGGTRRNPRVITTASQEGLPDGWIRATFIVQEHQLAQIKALAYWERKQIKEVITEALSAYLAGRQVEPLPEHRG
jgi:hypothetical protein